MREHLVSVESDFIGDEWNAVCSCGWKGDPCETMPQAVTDGQAHFAECKNASDE